jgi:CubicO group peptidase (beta-lactamase class C family)
VKITLDGWQKPPQLHWAFQRVADIFPTADIPPSRWLSPLGRGHHDLLSLRVDHPLGGEVLTVGKILEMTETDGWIVAKRGVILQEAYYDGMEANTRHLLMSVSKSIVSTVAGALVDAGKLQVDRPVADYVNQLAGADYGSAAVRDVLDMRSGIHFSEDYYDPDAEVRQLEEAFGWAPRTHPNLPDSLYEFLGTLRSERPHGVAYAYRSSETDVLGWVCEAAAGAPMAALIRDLVWEPIGAEFPADLAVDRLGAGMHDGGISASLRDLVRFGSIFTGDGTAWSGRRVVSPRWIHDTITGAADSVSVFAASDDGLWMPGGMYRHQFWFPSARRDALVALGIHGQMIYVDRSTDAVIAKLSSWPVPQDPARLYASLAAAATVATAIGEQSSPWP